MAQSTETNNHLATLALPSDAFVRGQIESWMTQAGWTDQDVADAIMKANGDNYSRIAVNLFRLGRYSTNGNPDSTRAIRAALLDLMDRSPVKLDRRALGKMYDTASSRLLRKAFFRSLDHGWSYGVDGPPGTQKSFLLLSLCEELQKADAAKNGHGRRAIYIYSESRIGRKELMAEICRAAGVMPRGTIAQMRLKLRHQLAGRRVLLAIDEAQHLQDDALEMVRGLLDNPPYLGIIVAGSHNLRRRLESPNFGQWGSRAMNIVSLAGLSEEELADIVTAEVGRMSHREIADLVKYCTVPDPYKRGSTYLSARKLFTFIESGRVDQAEKKEGRA